MGRNFIQAFVIGVLLLGTGMPAWAVEPSEILDDPVLEQRARVISKKLRCLVCQNQSIDESEADLARDLRIIVRERLVAGDSNEQVIDFVVTRYGDWVLLKPPFKAKTLVLWLAPLGIVGITGLMYWSFFRNQRRLGDDSEDPHDGGPASPAQNDV